MTKITREEIEKIFDNPDISHWRVIKFDSLCDLSRSWALGMVKEVRDVNESNGRYNACNELEKKIEEASNEKLA